MKICLIGGDVAPTNCFKALETGLETKIANMDVSAILGAGKPVTVPDSEIESSVCDADVLILGLSASAESVATEMFAARTALKAGIPYGYYSDMALCPFRPWLEGELAENASFVVGLLPADTTGVTQMYPRARCINTGNPLHGTMAFPSKGRDTVRTELGVNPEDKLILVSGAKFAAGNFQILSLLLEATRSLPNRENVVVMFLPHPGDSTLRAIDSASGNPLPLYAEMLEESGMRTLYAAMPTPVATVGADVVVDFTGDTSIRAAYLRVPLINIVTEVLLSRFEKEVRSREIATLQNGAGVSLSEFSVSCLSTTIIDLFDPSSSQAQKLREAQEIAYLIPTDQDASLNALIDAIVPH